MENKAEAKEEILSRMKKIEGQVKGIQKMIEEDKECSDVMVQISAIRSAINKVGGVIMDRYIKECVKGKLLHEKDEEKIEEIIDTIVKYVK
ncbi:MAG: metal-sensitive transcriptional regulator [Caulobacteraceae bacterium]